MFKDNDILIRFYTGMGGDKTFKTLFDSFGPAANDLVYYGMETDLETLCLKYSSSGGKQFRKHVSCFYAQGGNVGVLSFK